MLQDVKPCIIGLKEKMAERLTSGQFNRFQCMERDHVAREKAMNMEMKWIREWTFRFLWHWINQLLKTKTILKVKALSGTNVLASRNTNGVQTAHFTSSLFRYASNFSNITFSLRDGLISKLRF